MTEPIAQHLQESPLQSMNMKILKNNGMLTNAITLGLLAAKQDILQQKSHIQPL